MTLEITPLPALADNYIWALSPDNGVAGDTALVVVDPGEAEPVLAELARRSARLASILITHHHPDHTGGIERLLREGEVPVYGPARDSRPIPGLTHPLEEGDTVTPAGLDTTFRVIDVPGHTAGHIAYVGDGALFSGDTLFFGGCGRLFEGDAAEMRASLGKLRELPDDTRVYCGHEYTVKNLTFAAAVEPDNEDIAGQLQEVRRLRGQDLPTPPSDIALEKRVNPFMRWDEPALVRAAEAHTGRALPDADEVFAVVRAWKDSF